jgi:hypothetical protein
MNRSVIGELGLCLLFTGCLASRQAELDRKHAELTKQVFERQTNERIALMPDWLHDRPDGKKGLNSYQKDDYECQRDVDQTFPSRSVYAVNWLSREMDRHSMFMRCMRARGWTEQKKG